MDKITLMERMLEIINKYPEGTIFSIHDFYDLGVKNTIKSNLLRLEQKGEIVRLIDGLYTKPKYSKVIEEYSYPTVDDFAHKIADKFSWTICPSDDNALNMLGLSTQVSNKYLYVSDGPYREYNYRGRMILFRHTSNRYVTEYSKNLSLVIQALKTLGKNNVNEEMLRKIAMFCKKNVKEDLVFDTKKLPVWIQEVLHQIVVEMDHI